jgi:hypothetical protein
VAQKGKAGRVFTRHKNEPPFTVVKYIYEVYVQCKLLVVEFKMLVAMKVHFYGSSFIRR